MKPASETNVIHPYTRNLTYHSLDDNALQTITFDREIFLNTHRSEIIREIRHDSRITEDSVVNDVRNGKIRLKGSREFLLKLVHLEHFDSYSDAFLGETITNLKKKGIADFLDHCSANNLNPFVALSYYAVNFGKKLDDLDTKLIHDLGIEMDKNPGLNRFLNHVSIICARELGLINGNEALILRSLHADLTIQNFEVHGLDTLLRNARTITKKLKTSPFRRADSQDNEITALLSGQTLISFSSKLFALRGFSELQEIPKFSLEGGLNWDGEKTKGSSSRSGNRG